MIKHAAESPETVYSLITSNFQAGYMAESQRRRVPCRAGNRTTGISATLPAATIWMWKSRDQWS